MAHRLRSFCLYLFAFTWAAGVSESALAQVQFAPLSQCTGLAHINTFTLPYWVGDVEAVGDDHIIFGGDSVEMWRYMGTAFRRTATLGSDTRVHSVSAGDGFVITVDRNGNWSPKIYAPQSVPTGGSWWEALSWNELALPSWVINRSPNESFPPQVVALGTSVVTGNMASGSGAPFRIGTVCGTQPSICYQDVGSVWAQHTSNIFDIRMANSNGDLLVKHANWNRLFSLTEMIQAATTSNSSRIGYGSLPQPEKGSISTGTSSTAGQVGLAYDDAAQAMVILEHVPDGPAQLRVTTTDEAEAHPELAHVVFDSTRYPYMFAEHLQDVEVTRDKVYLLEREERLPGGSARLHILKKCW